jgi:hypothetical protein
VLKFLIENSVACQAITASISNWLVRLSMNHACVAGDLSLDYLIDKALREIISVEPAMADCFCSFGRLN